MVLEYQRDIPADSSEEVVEATKQHVRDHLAAIADADDDPSTRADDVRVWTARHPDNPDLIRIEGALDAEVDVYYMKDDYDPLAEVDPELFAQEVAAAQRDEEVLRGKE
jgi:hypothetical protein